MTSKLQGSYEGGKKDASQGGAGKAEKKERGKKKKLSNVKSQTRGMKKEGTRVEEQSREDQPGREPWMSPDPGRI